MQYLTPPFPYTPSKCNGNISLSIARLGSTSFSIAQARRFFDPNKTAVLSEVRINTFNVAGSLVKSMGIIPLNTRPIYSITIASLTGGGCVVAWEESTIDLKTRNVRAAVFKSAWSLLEPIILGIAPDIRLRNQGDAKPRVASLAQGGFVVTWTASPSLVSFLIYMSIYDSTYRKLVDRADVASGNVGYADVVGLKDGGFVVIYTRSGSRVEFKIFAPNGQIRAGSTLIGDSYSIRASAAPLSSGNFVLAWTSQLETGLYDAKIQTFLPNNGSASTLPITVLHNTSITKVTVADLGQTGFIVYSSIDAAPDQALAYDLNSYNLSEPVEIPQPGIDVIVAGTGDNSSDFVVVGSSRANDPNTTNITTIIISPTDSRSIDTCWKDVPVPIIPAPTVPAPTVPAPTNWSNDVQTHVDGSNLAVIIWASVGGAVCAATLVGACTAAYCLYRKFRGGTHYDDVSNDPPVAMGDVVPEISNT